MKEDEKWIKAFKDSSKIIRSRCLLPVGNDWRRELMPRNLIKTNISVSAGGRLLRQLWYWC